MAKKPGCWADSAVFSTFGATGFSAAGAAGSTATALTSASYGNWRPNIKIHYVPGTACSGAVNAGLANTSAAAVCPSVPYSLFLSGGTLASGITYQWQSATTATGPFTNITGAVNSSYQATQTVATSATTTVEMNTTALQAGSYIYNVVAGDKVATGKLIKQ